MNKFTEQQTMQITLALNDDVLNIARQKAQREHISLGAALSELMRLAIRSMQMPAARCPATGSKCAVLPARDETITSGHIYKLKEQEGI